MVDIPNGQHILLIGTNSYADGMSDQVDGRTLRHVHRRGEVLQAATEHVLDHGLDGLTLRKIARDVGVSHATLVHHFVSKERLVAEIVDLVLADTLQVPDVVKDQRDTLREIWRRLTRDSEGRYAKLFVAITGQAVYGGSALRNAVAASMQHRAVLIAEGLVRHGVPREQAQPAATAFLATMRGLFSDLVITGDHERVDAAFEDALSQLEERVTGRTGISSLQQ